METVVLDMNDVHEQLFCGLSKAFLGASKTNEISATNQDLNRLFKLARKHDVDNIIAWGFKNNASINNSEIGIEETIFKAVYRYERMNYEYIRLCEKLENSKVKFIPLKGAKMREYYPEPWMRTSCDIDILVREKDIELAKSIMINGLKYTYHGKGPHDLSLYSPSNIHVELHYDLVEYGLANQSSNVLKSVWDTAVPYKNKQYWYEMSDEMFYFYHIAHMAKHFENGGCGVRSFIDLWLLDRIDGFDISKRDELLKQGNLSTFANSARKLTKIWFEDEERDLISKQMEDYVLQGGIYGNSQNRIKVQQQKKGGSVKYALSKIFLPYDSIKFHYPILQNKRWLTPFMQVRRWCKLLFCGHLRRVTKELKYNKNISTSQAAGIQEFLDNIGL